VVLFIVLIAACSAAPIAAPIATSKPPVDPKQSILSIGVTQEPQTFDPQVNVATISAQRYYPNIYETLLQYTPDGKLAPMLADSWSVSQDARTYQFKLHPGVKFSDGTPFNSAAVKAAFDRLRAIGKGPVGLLAPVGSIEPIDDLTVEFRLSQPYAPLLAILAGWQSAIFVSPTAIQANDGGDNAQTWLQTHTAGTGPYQLDRWDPNSRIVLTRNANSRTSPPADGIQQVVYTFMGDTGTLRQVLEAGDIDIAAQLPPALIAPLQNAAGVTLALDDAPGSPVNQSIVFNLARPPFDNADLRRAMAYAIDYKRLVAVWNGSAVQAQGRFLPGFTPWFSATDSIQYQQDMAMASMYLQKAGYPANNAGIKFNLIWQSGFTGQRDMAQLIKEDLAKLGIDVTIIEAQIPVWRDAIWNHTFEAAFFQADLRYNDPDADASLLLVSSEYRANGFNPGIRDPHIDALIKTGQQSVDEEQRRQAYNEIQRTVTGDVLFLYLVNTKFAWARGNNVTGVVWNPNYGPFFRAAEITKTSTR
jgi:peptide/nickel transport system substrate-binding protein